MPQYISCTSVRRKWLAQNTPQTSLDVGLGPSGPRSGTAAARKSAAVASWGSYDGVGVPYDQECPTNAQCKQSAATNTTGCTLGKHINECHFPYHSSLWSVLQYSSCIIHASQYILALQFFLLSMRKNEVIPTLWRRAGRDGVGRCKRKGHFEFFSAKKRGVRQ